MQYEEISGADDGETQGKDSENKWEGEKRTNATGKRRKRETDAREGEARASPGDQRWALRSRTGATGARRD